MPSYNIDTITAVIFSTDLSRDYLWYLKHFGLKHQTINAASGFLVADSFRIKIIHEVDRVNSPGTVSITVLSAESIYTLFQSENWPITEKLFSNEVTGELHFAIKDPSGNLIYVNQSVSKASHISSGKADSIGGLFIKSKDPVALRSWYNKCLGIKTDEYGATFVWFDNRSSTPRHTVLGIFPMDSDYFEPSKNNFMINFRVNNLRDLILQLKANGVPVIGEIDSYPHGDFIHILDPENNKIELWEPNDIEFSLIVKGNAN